jgi:DNA-binding transcriptional ArsR family regulator
MSSNCSGRPFLLQCKGAKRPLWIDIAVHIARSGMTISFRSYLSMPESEAEISPIRQKPPNRPLFDMRTKSTFNEGQAIVEDDSTRRSGYFRIDDAFVDHAIKQLSPQKKNLRPYAGTVYIVLCRHADGRGLSYPSVTRIAERGGMSPRQVVRSLKVLEEAGVIETCRGRGKNNQYRLCGTSEWAVTNGRTSRAYCARGPVTNGQAKGYTDKGHTLKGSSGGPSTLNTLDHKEARRLATLLFDLIIQNNAHSRLKSYGQDKKERTLQGWLSDIEQLMRNDKQSPEMIEHIIQFATSDSFWGSIILSGAGLRRRWDTLTSQFQRRDSHGGQRPGTGTGKASGKEGRSTIVKGDGTPYRTDHVES